MDAYKTTRNITKAECYWLDADIPAGTTVYKYTGVTYGCISPRGIAVTMAPDELPFVELPRSALAADGGSRG